MKKFLSRIVILIMWLSSIPLSLLAATTGTPGKIHSFTIIAPPSAKVGEAIDITVEAHDKDDQIITGYRGSIFFQSDTDFGATIPAQGKAIQFKESDNGVLKISKGVIFKRVGNQELTVTEALEDVSNSVKIRIEDSSTEAPPTTPSETITILTPEKGSTITSDTVLMSGKTKKNSKVIIKLNGQEVGNAQSNDDGIFTYNITGISQQSNSLNVSVVDGANTVLGTIDSQFNYGVKAPTYYNTTISPALEVDTSTGITITIDAEPGLSEVTVSLDGTTLKAAEQSPGKYIITTRSPAKSGSYPLQVDLKNVLAQVTTKANAATLTVKEAVVPTPTPPVENPVVRASFRDLKVTTDGWKVNINFFVDTLPKEVTKFKIAYGENSNSLSNEVVTFPVEKIRRPDWSYNWYIDKLDTKAYTFKVFGVQADGTLLADFASESVSATIGKSSCTIGNIGDIAITTTADKTVLSWDSVTWALSYNVYRMSAAKDYELVENIKNNSYTIYVASGSLVYQDFAVKALCDSQTESSVPAVASKVRTGPGFLSVLVILSSIIAIVFLRRRSA